MGKTFVFNEGSSPPHPIDLLELEYGLFFDGTLSNRIHTEIRKKVEGKGEFKNIAATSGEKEIYDKYAKKNNSFGNDFTNVARKFYCCDEKYRIYIEGIGTVDEKVDKKKDSISGSAYGRGETGIIAKVRSGCDKLAKNILKNIDKSKGDEINKIHLTIDAFGYSRGAAAARNFLYNLQMKPYSPEIYYPPESYNMGYYSMKPITPEKRDHNKEPIESNFLKDGKLPRFGHLGTALLKAGLKREQLDTMVVKVRFLGIYDTVASYDPSCLLFPNFKKQIKKLHLHELGNPEKAVHFTAMDEHRKLFSLTRLKLSKGIELNLPGVHSDVGGGFNHDSLSLDEINKYKGAKPNLIEGVCKREYILLDSSFFYNKITQFRDELIEQGWYKEEQLSLIDSDDEFILGGTRYLYRGYSFIPLHFMCDYALPLLNRNKENLKEVKILYDYALKDEFLEKVKKYLKTHTVENGNDWELEGNFSKKNSPKEEKLLMQRNIDVPLEQTLPEIKIIAKESDLLLRELRNRYLHRSAEIYSIVNAANKGRQRREY